MKPVEKIPLPKAMILSPMSSLSSVDCCSIKAPPSPELFCTYIKKRSKEEANTNIPSSSSYPETMKIRKELSMSNSPIPSFCSEDFGWKLPPPSPELIANCTGIQKPLDKSSTAKMDFCMLDHSPSPSEPFPQQSRKTILSTNAPQPSSPNPLSPFEVNPALELDLEKIPSLSLDAKIRDDNTCREKKDSSVDFSIIW
eukprot:CAMPEP_0167764818 /NCGR_PEP_ID=MMETSP0110_2-20121227/14279_1 /TAXON_ID=629695 /ORGANISM="Gymnochlora sp., Strain CCMP2014" /LENGTH=197 /DNA_ID=CAMNT_0007652335 /DNA_START=182 /DNA_END=772 /DNA_ORIENTATION=+